MPIKKGPRIAALFKRQKKPRALFRGCPRLLNSWIYLNFPMPWTDPVYKNRYTPNKSKNRVCRLRGSSDQVFPFWYFPGRWFLARANFSYDDAHSNRWCQEVFPSFFKVRGKKIIPCTSRNRRDPDFSGIPPTASPGRFHRPLRTARRWF